MASETLSIPEEALEEFIAILRAGMNEVKADGGLSEDVRLHLEEWCEEEEEYLQRLAEGDDDDWLDFQNDMFEDEDELGEEPV